MLVIGYGSPLREDDGVALRLVEKVESLHLAGVETQALPQLQVEVVHDLSRYDTVVFVDAGMDGPDLEWATLRPVESQAPASTHHLTPEGLLGLHALLFGDPPEAFFLTIRGDSFEFREGLSEATVDRLQDAFFLMCLFLAEEVSLDVL